jgi:3-isopropylmalate/(R)-2-methylmalate dehydratase small subunit
MEPLVKVKGVVAVLDRVNVDTDQIIPKQFLKRIERTGFGKFLFFDWRYQEDGSPNPVFELNQERYEGASILIAGSNFGCGSSREHAPWALLDFGFRVIIAPSFADIFYINCFKNGMLPIRLPAAQIETLKKRTAETIGYEIEVDLEACQIRDDQGHTILFEVEDFRRENLLRGMDEIALTLGREDAIARFEQQHRVFR